MKKQIVHIDMDGVIADFAKMIERNMPDLLTEYETDEERHDAVEQFCITCTGVFYDLEPIEGAKAAVWQLNELYDVYFLSTPMWVVPQSFTDKRRWLETHFGKLAEKKLILTHRKDLVIGDFLIDDRTAHGADRFTGMHIHYGTGSWPGWAEITKYLVRHAATVPVKI